MGRKRLKKSITIDNMYCKYQYRHQLSSPHYVEKSQYKKIAKEFYKVLSYKIIEDGFKFDLPLRLGSIYITKFKSEKRQIDWKLTGLHDMRIYHTNKHSEGYAARWWWKPSRNLKYHNLYRFKATRYNNRSLAKGIKDNNSIVRYPNNI